MLKRMVQVAVYFILLGVILFLGAGHIDWPMAWLLLALYLGNAAVIGLLVDRDLIEERGRIGAGVEKWDVVLGSLAFLGFLASLFVAALDAGRFQWSPTMPLAVQLLALALFAAGNALFAWAMVSNRYFSTIVRVQMEREHQTITGGPYRYVRHPGYVGFILSIMAAPLALSSLWALVPALGGVASIGARTALEDRMLSQKLAGYADYARQVPYRLLPGVW